MMSVTEKAVSVRPFAIEADTPRNGDLIIQSLGLLRLRGAVSASVMVFDKQWNEEDYEEGEQTRPAPARLIDGIGELPGVCLFVNPGKLEWELKDPLYKKENKLEFIRKALRRVRGVRSTGDRLQGMKPQKGTVDVDTMKSLCRELLCFIEADEARVIKGTKPTMEDIEAMPGRFLLNNVNMSGWMQPKYEDQYLDWVNRRSQLDGV